MRAFFSALILLGCGTLPETVTVGIGLPPALRAAAYNAREKWCDAVDYCPEIVAYGGVGEVRVANFARERRDDCVNPENGMPCDGSGAHNDNGIITVSPLWLGGIDLEFTLLHEWGHFGIDGHPRRSPLMSPQHPVDEPQPHAIDSIAVKEWCEQQGC